MLCGFEDVPICELVPYSGKGEFKRIYAIHKELCIIIVWSLFPGNGGIQDQHPSFFEGAAEK